MVSLKFGCKNLDILSLARFGKLVTYDRAHNSECVTNLFFIYNHGETFERFGQAINYNFPGAIKFPTAVNKTTFPISNFIIVS